MQQETIAMNPILPADPAALEAGEPQRTSVSYLPPPPLAGVVSMVPIGCPLPPTALPSALQLSSVHVDVPLASIYSSHGWQIKNPNHWQSNRSMLGIGDVPLGQITSSMLGISDLAPSRRLDPRGKSHHTLGDVL